MKAIEVRFRYRYNLLDWYANIIAEDHEGQKVEILTEGTTITDHVPTLSAGPDTQPMVVGYKTPRISQVQVMEFEEYVDITNQYNYKQLESFVEDQIRDEI